VSLSRAPRPSSLSGLLLALLAAAWACQPHEADAPSAVGSAEFAEEHGHAAQSAGVGAISFPTSCSEEAQPVFERAVAMLHSFWFQEAEDTFQEAARIDPDCAMAHWGRAMNLWGNPMTRAAPPEARVQAALEALETARTLAESATPRERMYIEAAAALYEGHPDVGHMERMQAHERAMRRLMDAHPEDPEAAIFYGRIVVGNAPPDDLTFSRQLHAAEIMEPIFADQPDHPGLAHYLIHAYDAPAIAERGLEAALLYADIAPDAPHALHMPTHIFTRMGYWEESIELNARSAAAEPVPDAAVHPMDYMVYAYLQLGRDREAAEVVARAENIPDRYYGGLIGYNFAAMQARFSLERERWEEAAGLPLPVDAFPYVEGVTRFARGLGSARAGDPAAGREEVRRMAELRDRTRDSGDEYWATVLEAQRLAVTAWVALAEGDAQEALELARAAADLEDTVEKHPVTPGPLLPARELLGDLLLEMDRPGEALEAYRATLQKERNRARTLFGAARAAEAAGDEDAAGQFYSTLLELLENGDEDRRDLQAARLWAERG
jgi:tetratricopeptide (TPR) repeat protein